MFAKLRPSLKFILLWLLNAGIAAALFLLLDLDRIFPMARMTTAELIAALGLALAALEMGLLGRLRGE